ncbi:MAG: hypothetical protein WA738_17090, partial [Candidatus Angelobacter sp.]
MFHTRASDPQPQRFNLNGNQIANWTFTGSSGTTSPVAPSQGTSITFTAPPPPVPAQQVDTITGCKVDEHGTDCNSAQIIVEVLGVSIPPSNWDLEPPTNPDELLGGEKVKYNAITTQGGRDVAFTVTWTKTAETSGGDFVTVDADGTVTVQPQDAFQGNDFTVDIQATNPIDPTVAKSGIFPIHIPTATVKLTTTPFPGLNEPPFEAKENRAFRFVATVTGPQKADNRLVTWSQKVLTFAGNPGVFTFPLPDGDTTDYLIPSSFPPTQAVTVTISACVGGTVDAFGDPVHAICDTFPLSLVPPVHATSPPQTINSGESTPVTITGTGFGAATVLSFSDPTVTFTLASISGPNVNGVTTVTGTMTAAPVPAPIPFRFKIIPVTITSSLPPPSTPVNQNVLVRPVTTTPAVTPVNPTLTVSQSQQFTPSLGCLTSGGNTCTVPQTSTCSLFSGVGTMSTSCLYTAPAALATQTQVQGRACFTFGNICTGFSINVVPPPPPNPASNSSLNSYFDASGLYHIFYEAANQHLYEIYGNGNVPTGYIDLTLAAGAPPAASGSALAFFFDSGNSPHWAYIGTTGRINLIAQVGTAYNFYDLTTWAGNSPAAAPGSPLIASFQATNYAQMWSYIGVNQHIYQLYGNSISAPAYTDITASAASAPVAASGSALAFFMDSGNSPHWAYIGTTGRINLIAQVGTAYSFCDLTTWAGNSPAAAPGSPLIASFQA